MKKLGMMNMSWFFTGLAIMLVFGFSACSNDDEENKIPAFPAEQKITCNANEEKEFSFEANMDWKLTSSAPTWCMFVADGFEEASLAGTAGKQTVTIKVTDKNQEFEESTAKLELTMGSEKSVIATVTRSSKAYELKVFDAEGAVIEQIEVGYNDYIEFTVEANFDFAAADIPEWITIEGGSMVGSASQKVAGKVKIIQDGSREKYPVAADKGEVIRFANEAGSASFSIPVFYQGMSVDAIEISGNTPWGWTVSLDGKTFQQTAGTGDPITLEGNVPFTIKALEDEYEFFYAELGENKIYLTDENGQPVTWMKVKKDNNVKGNISVEIDEFTPSQWGPASRTGCIIAFPKAVYESSIATIVDGSDFDEISTIYQANILMEVSQKAASSGFTIRNGSTWEPVASTKETDSEILEMIQGNWQIADVYTMTVGADESYLVFPEISTFDSESKWGAMKASGEDIDASELGGLEIGMEGENYYVNVSTPASFTEPVIVYFIDSTWQNKKALVIRPNL